MARWKLTDKHYLNVLYRGIEHEIIETDLVTMRQNRLRIPVPMYLDPERDEYYNYPELGSNGKVIGGEVIVCYEGKGLPRDYIINCPPTPYMEPLDEEAEAITNEWKEVWIRQGTGMSGDPMGVEAFPPSMTTASQLPRAGRR